MDAPATGLPQYHFSTSADADAYIRNLQDECNELRAKREATWDTVREQAHTLHQLRAAVEPFVDNLREMLERLAEVLDFGHLEYGTGYLDGSTPCILSKLTELLDILGIDPVSENDGV